MKKEILQVKSNKKISQNNVPTDIVEYAKFRGFELTPDQIIGLESVLTNKPTIIASAHSIGKTTMCAILIAYFFEHNPNGIALVTAPTNHQITSVLFRQLRQVLPNNPYFAPKANSLYEHSNHWVIGISPSNPESWQGKHNSKGGMLIVIDECYGVDQVFFERSLTMIEPGRKDHYMLACGNPYSKSSAAYLESLKPVYNTIHISALTHPNVLNKKEVIPGAISYENVKNRVGYECREAQEHEEHKAFEFDGNKYISESPIFDTAVLGRYPETSDFCLWTENDIQNLLKPITFDNRDPVAISCDPARYGTNSSVIMVRIGMNIVEMQSYKGLSLNETAIKIKHLCHKYAKPDFHAYQVPVYIDGCGLGVGLIDMKNIEGQSYNFIEVLNSSSPNEEIEEKVNNKRTELWLEARNYARKGQLSIAMLPKHQQDSIINELRMVQFSVNLKGKIVLEDKKQIMKRLGGASPDHADALSLACYTDESQYESHF